MSFFLPTLKQWGFLDSIQITLCIVGSRKIDEFAGLDYDRQGWEIFAPNLTIYGFDADPEACDRRNAELVAKNIGWTEKHIPFALWDRCGKAPLYVTKHPGCCSLYPPNDVAIERLFEYRDRHKLMSVAEVETTTLDDFFGSLETPIDFMQLDVQGAELNVLKGGDNHILPHLLGIVAEVNFIELYKNQPLFADVDSYLRDRDFTLFDIGQKWCDRRRGITLISRQHKGQFVWTDGYYFRDLIRPDQNHHLKTPERILKLACLADLLQFYDYALELLGYLTERYGAGDRNYNFADCIIQILEQNPDAVKHGITALPFITELRKYRTQ
ncbi:FkbM family methyltransferase [Lyngbya sp. CCY1209]|jgi:FkbM family methyltransferase|uniref:FkbM family methyltransferase n=1 Tax=Lyngbya sp. CCY1209 TaxID=2886103 RepID=UPI002D20E3C9|nr:FkbM family methyltransferase [Lyngbya sp. CCY1209]MEB3881822.1 FkbM family methyltransferase [Lyngbya sp. CCY1209]